MIRRFRVLSFRVQEHVLSMLCVWRSANRYGALSVRVSNFLQDELQEVESSDLGF